jgi:hypothetical protein
MLTAARAALVELGALAPTAALPPFWARMSGNLVLMVYPQKPPFFVVKVRVRKSLDREFLGLRAGHEAMPRHVPRPLGLTTRHAHEVLVIEGVPHQPLVRRHGRHWHPLFERDMGALLATGAQRFCASPTDSTLDPREALDEAATMIDWSGWQAYRDHVDPVIARLPRVLQHGDLALNNIAIAGDGLVFFDWEDWGQVALPGFDLAVALLSLHDFGASNLSASLRAPTMEARLALRWSEQFDFPPAIFSDLMPAYLSLFVKMKRFYGYHAAVPARAVAALREWIDQASAVAPSA